MLTKQTNSIEVWKPVRRAALVGGVIATELALLTIAGNMGAFWPILFLALGVAVLGAAITAGIGYLISPRKDNSLDKLEHELAKAAAILERGLINEAEYHRIKGQVLEQYQYGRRGSSVNLWRLALWGSAAGLLMPLSAIIGTYDAFMYFVYTVMAAGFGAGTLGGGTAIVKVIQRKLSQPQLPGGTSGSRPLIDAKPQRSLER